jgi:hypothetical protein
MSYQVNYRFFVPDCAYWEAEKVASLQAELHEAFVRIVTQAGVTNKQMGLPSAETVYLTK